jgi:choline dehydrogenase-like flavoprotein
MRQRLTPRSRAALDALCRRIVPAAYESEPPAPVVDAVEQRIATLDGPLAGEVVGALHFFDHPITGMLLSGRPRRFSGLPPAQQDALLHEWERSPLRLRRTVFQALRRLILATWYTLEQGHREAGFLPPLHLRGPVFAWEGPAPARAKTGDEPVARVGAAPQRPVRWPAGVQDVAQLGADARIVADVCVIGSGAGGAVAAARLAEAGSEVVVLEEGGFFTGEDFDDDEARLTPLLYADAGARATDDLSYVLLQGRCVGGGTTVNWLMTLRPQPWVLHEWEHEHRIELLSARRLLPALERIEDAIHARPVPEDAHSAVNRVILDGCARLGWRTLDARINASGCVRAGSCGLGCRWGAKQGAGDVFLPRALRAGARVLCNAQAHRIEVVERGGNFPLKRVTATALGRGGTPVGRITVEAPVVVLAGGGIGTPALLEMSGLAGPAVGRWLRLHPTTAVLGLYDRTMYGAAGVPQSAACAEFLEGADGYGSWIEAAPLRPGLAAAALQGFGAPHRDIMRAFPRLAPLIVLVRDGAERHRSGGDVRVDRRRRVRIRYRLSAADRSTLVTGVQAAARLHHACGAQYALTLHVDATPLRTEQDIARLPLQRFGPNRVSMFSAHVNGTCRMGHSGRDAGTTPEGEVFGVNGLYVADGSLFPTAPGVNPQSTIMAVASLVAERIVERMQAGPTTEAVS